MPRPVRTERTDIRYQGLPSTVELSRTQEFESLNSGFANLTKSFGTYVGTLWAGIKASWAGTDDAQLMHRTGVSKSSST